METAAQGDVLLAPALTARLLSRHVTAATRADDAGRVLERLTAHEREVLERVARGLSNDEIARELFLSPATVKTHVSALLDKLGARDRVQLVVLAFARRRRHREKQGAHERPHLPHRAAWATSLD